jgi:hypothetical protein
LKFFTHYPLIVFGIKPQQVRIIREFDPDITGILYPEMYDGANRTIFDFTNVGTVYYTN